MNRLMFKKIFTLMYKALTNDGWNEDRMYGHDFNFRIQTISDHYFSIWFIGCRTPFVDAETGRGKSFGSIDELNNLEAVYSDYERVKQLLGEELVERREMHSDHNTLVSHFYTVLDDVQIDWISVVQNWLKHDILISESFERNCSIKAAKIFRKDLAELISY